MASAADHELPAASHWVLGRKPGPKGIAVNVVLTSKGCWGVGWCKAAVFILLRPCGLCFAQVDPDGYLCRVSCLQQGSRVFCQLYGERGSDLCCGMPWENGKDLAVWSVLEQTMGQYFPALKHFCSVATCLVLSHPHVLNPVGGWNKQVL